MAKEKKKIIGCVIGVVFLASVALGFLFSELLNTGDVEDESLGDETAFIIVTVDGDEIESSPIEVDVEKEMTVLDYMIENFDVEGADEGFVTSIDDYEQSEEDGLYWMYYVNDEMPSVGAGEQELEDEDVVEWKLEAFE